MAGDRILVAGLSPAWQQILRFSSLQIGEVNRALEAHWCASGKVLNVARACAALGAPTSVVSVLGGLSGLAIRDEFRELDVRSEFVETEASTRVCTTILDDATGKTTELIENAGPLPTQAIEQFQENFYALAKDAGVVVFTGSLPQGVPASFVPELLEPIRVPLILDMRGPELLECLRLKPLLVKPNREELSKTTSPKNGMSLEGYEGMHELIIAGAENVAVSNGAQGLDVMWRSIIHRMTSPAVQAVNPIGCGDCLAGGVAVATLEGKTMLDALAFGMGAAAQNATMLLPARIDRVTSDKLASEVRWRRYPQDMMSFS